MPIFYIVLVINPDETLNGFIRRNSIGVPVRKLHITLCSFSLTKENVALSILHTFNELERIISSFVIKTQDLVFVRDTNLLKVELNPCSSRKVNVVRDMVLNHFQKCSFLQALDMKCKPHITLFREVSNKPFDEKLNVTKRISHIEIIMWDNKKNETISSLNGHKIKLK